MSVPIDPTLPSLPPRPSDAHKGTFGTALIIGGSRGMTGAVALAGHGGAARRGGIGTAGGRRPLPGDRRRLRAFLHDRGPAGRHPRPDQRRGPYANRRTGPVGNRRRDGAGLGTFARPGSPRRAALPRVVVADGLRCRCLERIVHEARVAAPSCRAARAHAASRRVRPPGRAQVSGRGAGSCRFGTGRPLPRGRRAQGPPHLRDRWPPALAQLDGQPRHGHRRLRRLAHRA